jgi:hypothetical protein
VGLGMGLFGRREEGGGMGPVGLGMGRWWGGGVKREIYLKY